MNEAPDSERPADASDPLLEALRQRLGPSFGQEPPPTVWAGIRQQLPPAPRPWRLRARRLLPLLLLLSVLTVGILTVRPPHGRTGWLTVNSPAAAVLKQPAAAARQPLHQHTKPAGQVAANHPRALASPAARPDLAAPAAEQPTATVGRSLPTPPANSVASEMAIAPAARPTTRSTTSRLQAAVASAALPAAGRRQQLSRSRASTATLRREAHPAAAPAASVPLPVAAELPAQPPLTPQQAARRAKATRRQTVASLAVINNTAARRRARHRLAPRPNAVALVSNPTTHDKAVVAAASRSRNTARLAARTPRHQPEDLPLTVTEEALGRFAAPDTAGPAYEPLAHFAPELALPGRLPLPTLTADTVQLNLPPVRRWSVLVLAGPTLSYRSAGTLAISQPTYASAPTSVANSPAYYYTKASPSSLLERPALGWGAQVQVRRVLSGRWALALGLGYQEYATRLADSVGASRVHLRDTYRLLTVPVQLGYALGPPRGRLALGLLAGAEPGWYQGGRTTEGSSCACQQQTFTQAAGSPYTTWTVALSLGLDLRYQLGGPASRWQLLVQPTGRYIATPFVRSNADLLYLRRQPYSLGLLTGVAWSWR